MAFVKTIDLLNAVGDRLKAMTVSEDDATLLFSDVKVFDREDLVAAMEALYLFDDRLAILIPGGWQHRSVKHGTDLRMRRRTEFMLMLTDRNFSGENTALVGEPGTNPGILELAERVVAELAGLTLERSADWVALEPGTGEVLRLTNQERDQASARDAWSQDFATEAGEVVADMGRVYVDGSPDE